MARRALSFGNETGDFRVIGVLLVSAALALAGCASSGYQHTRHLVAGNEAAQAGNFVDAASAYEKALAEVPNSLPARRNLGIVMVKVADYERALELLGSVAKEYAEDTETLYFLGEACRGLRRYGEAAKHYQAGLRVAPNDLRLTKALGWTWHKMGQSTWAINLMEPFLQRNKDDRQIRLILASAENKTGRYDRAIALLEPALKAAAQSPTNSNVAQDVSAEEMLMRTALAEAYVGKNDCKQAQALFQQVLRVRPFLDSALVGSARCHLEAKRGAVAVAMLERAVKSNPDSPEAHFYLARALEDTDRNRSVVYFNRFLQLTKDAAKANKKERAIARKAVARSSSDSARLTQPRPSR